MTTITKKEDDEPTEEVIIPAHKRKKKGRKPLPENLPRIEVVHDLTDDEKLCQCGCQKLRIGEETSEQLNIIPAKVMVMRNICVKTVKALTTPALQ